MADLNNVVEADIATIPAVATSIDYVLPSNTYGIKMIGRTGNVGEIRFRALSTGALSPIPENEWVNWTDRNLAGRTINFSGTNNDIVDILIRKGEGE